MVLETLEGPPGPHIAGAIAPQSGSYFAAGIGSGPSAVLGGSIARNFSQFRVFSHFFWEIILLPFGK